MRYRLHYESNGLGPVCTIATDDAGRTYTAHLRASSCLLRPWQRGNGRTDYPPVSVPAGTADHDAIGTAERRKPRPDPKLLIPGVDRPRDEFDED
jgi:hypothetical protein